MSDTCDLLCLDLRKAEAVRAAQPGDTVRGDLAVKIFGPNPDELRRLAGEIVQTLQALPGSEDVITAQNGGVQYYRIEIDRQAAGRRGERRARVRVRLRFACVRSRRARCR